MAAATLRISEDFALPAEVAAEALAILGTKGSGKSSTCAVLAEELWDAAVQFCVFDPTGVFWGLRSSSDGDGDGIPVTILGGPHGDAPLEPTAGTLIADVLVDTGQSLILDLSDFPSKAAQTRFATDLAERLYRRKARARSVLHLIVDEAEEFVPQDVRGDGARMVGAWETIVALGRSRGLGATLVSRRVQAVNKKVLDLIETLLAMRTGAPLARKRIEGWIEAKEVEDEQGVVGTLKSLPTGTAWVWSPLRHELVQVAVRRIRTFDSYETPKPGETPREARVLAPIDVDALGAKIAATVEQARENDPAELRSRLRSSEQKRAEAEQQVRELAAWQHDVSHATGGPHVIDELLAVYQAAKSAVGFSCDVVDEALALRDAPGERVEVPVLSEEQLAKLSGLLLETRHAGDDLAGRIADAVRPLEDAITRAAESRASAPPPSAVRARARSRLADSGILIKPNMAPFVPTGGPVAETVTANGDLGTGAKHLLATLGQHHPVRLTVGQLGLLARRKPRGGAWNSALKQLREGGYVEEPGGLVVLSPRGIELSGANVGDLSAAERVERWREALPPAALDLFDSLVASYPATMTVEELAAATERKPTGGSWNSAVATLVRNGLAEKSGDVLAATDLAAGR